MPARHGGRRCRIWPASAFLPQLLIFPRQLPNALLLGGGRFSDAGLRQKNRAEQQRTPEEKVDVRQRALLLQ